MTLLEVMLALVLLLVLSVGVMGFFFQITARRDQLVRLASQQRDISLLFDRVESALLSAVAVSPDGAAGIKGDATSLTVTTRGVTPSFGNDAALSDACTTSFVFNEQAAQCSQSVAASGSESDALNEPLLSLVERMQFRYSDGKNWRSTFDSIESGGLPVAVEVSVWFAPREPRGERVDPVPGVSMGNDGGTGSRGGALGSEVAEFGLGDFSGPESEAPAWTPREPDHVRVISVPDAPDWEERS